MVSEEGVDRKGMGTRRERMVGNLPSITTKHYQETYQQHHHLLLY